MKHKSAQNQNVTLHRIEDAEHQWKLPYKRELFAKLHDITFATKPQQTTNKSSRILKILPAESNSAKNETRKESCFITLGRGKKNENSTTARETTMVECENMPQEVVVIRKILQGILKIPDETSY